MVQSIGITKDNVDVWKEFLKNSVKFVEMYRSLLDTYVLDFFTEDLWNHIKPGWREVLIELTPSQLADFLCDNALRQEKVWPLSLQALRASAFAYTLPRKSVTTDASFKAYLRRHRNRHVSESEYSSCATNFKQGSFCSHGSNSDTPKLDVVNDNYETNLSTNHPLQETAVVSWEEAFSELNPKTGQHKLLQHVFRRHLKPKKQHEVARLAYIAGNVARCACDSLMVDVGSGQGHLSRFLAYGHNVRVLCLEAQDEFIRGAKKFDNQLKETVDKMHRKYENLPPLPPPPRHTHCHLEPNMDPQVFREVVTSAWPELESCGFEHGLLGLHTCGDLGPTLLRIFANSPACHGVVSVGCCYMKLTVNDTGISYPGYPMSKFVQSLKGNHLSYEAREVACHAIEMYSERLHLGADNLKVHCYRAALEDIIVKHWPEHRHAGLRSVNHAHKMEFAEYAEAAVSRLKDVSLNKEDLNSEKTKENLGRWMQVVVYYSLRLLLAPVVESVILLDRLIFLYEEGIEGILLPAFDPLLSPRNHVLVAIKNKEVL
ncbi:methyltransferase-like protein 25B [Macrobrachium rosenbergii]|uniref:methyltransferase-like protein 25B n=1 Tax=Macrobrachium rosenbergii TaxID=79674 RepID=UPI0034D6D538